MTAATPPSTPAPASQGNALAGWIRTHRVPLLFALLLLLILPMRDLWSPDEPDFAQCVREMRDRGSWLLPYLNGQPYSEKPILFYWLMKLSAMGCERLTGGAGFNHGIAAWALRLPSVLAAMGFMFGFRAWVARFARRELADPAALILAAVGIYGVVVFGRYGDMLIFGDFLRCFNHQKTTEEGALSSEQLFQNIRFFYGNSDE